MRSTKKLALAVVVAVVAACSTSSATYPLSASRRSPAAVGSIKVHDEKGANTRLSIVIEHVPRPEDLDPMLSTYVIWAKPAGDREMIPLGEVDVGASRGGKVEVMTPFQTFDVIVTAES